MKIFVHEPNLTPKYVDKDVCRMLQAARPSSRHLASEIAVVRLFH